MKDFNSVEHEYRNLWDDPWAPFNSGRGFRLASWLIEGGESKSRIHQYFLSGLGDAKSVRYSSMHMLENHLWSLDPHSQYLQ